MRIIIVFEEVLCDHPGRGRAALKRTIVGDRRLDNVSRGHLQSRVIDHVLISLSAVPIYDLS